MTGKKRYRSLMVSALLFAFVLGLAGCASEGRYFVNLNGPWETRPNPGLRTQFPPAAEGWEAVTIPEKGNAKFIKRSKLDWSFIRIQDLEKNGISTDFDAQTGISAWYRKEFRLPNWSGKKTVKLSFDRLLTKGVIWVNGQKAGECVTGISRTVFDITPYVKKGAANSLVVWVGGIQALMDLEHKLYIAPKPGHSGILGDVDIEVMSPLHIDDVYVRTSYRNQRIDVDFTVSNQSGKRLKFRPLCEVVRGSDRRPVLAIRGEAVEIPAGQTQVVTVGREWANPHLWSQKKPFLYNAICVLKDSGDRVIDEYDQRFGFREFWIDGKDYRLNGKKITLYRTNSGGMGVNDYDTYFNREESRTGLSIKETLHKPYNHFRQWGQSSLVPTFADEVGFTIDMTLSKFYTKMYPVEQPLRGLWLPNQIEHIQKVVRNNRNHPSIVIWNMANENYWNQVPENPKIKEVCKALIAGVRAVDPVRPLDGDAEVAWDGLLDVVSIHYPGFVGPVSAQYPNSDYIVPNDLWWIRDGLIKSWRAHIPWDRPLSIGEYAGNSTSTPNGLTSFGGEEAYDWMKAESLVKGKKWVQLQQIRMITDVFRVQGVACVNPWVPYGADMMPKYGLSPLDFHPNFFGGETAKRKLAMFFESDNPLGNPRLENLLRVDGRTVWKDIRSVRVPRGTSTLDVEITPPLVKEPVKAEWIVRVRYSKSAFQPVRMQHSETVYILPRTSLAGVPTASILLADATGHTAKRLASVGLKLAPVKAVTAGALKGKRLLVIAGDFPLNDIKVTVMDFVRAGGNALLLQRAAEDNLGRGYPEIDSRHAASRVWKRTYNHPVFAGLDNGRLSFWRPDNLVSKLSYAKPIDGDSRILLDAGGLSGLEWAPLCETPLGKGVMLLSQLSLLDRLDVEPEAGDMLARLIDYGLKASAPETRTLRVLAGDNKKLVEVLDACRILYTKGLDGDGPVLWDAAYKPSAGQIDALKAYLADGGSVWLHGFTPETAKEAARVLPFEPKLTQMDPRVVTAVRVCDSPLLNNLSHGDFKWATIQCWSRTDYFGGAKSHAKLGDYFLELPYLGAGTPLVAPALLTAIPVGKGTVLFDTVDWENAVESEGDRVVRSVSALAMNLGGGIRKLKNEAFKYFPVSLAQQANMGYVDEVAEDGKGGWLDMGRYDLCFFLTNHTERMGGDGAAIAVEPFPTNPRFRGIPFQLVDPKANDGKGLIALRSKVRALKLPAEVKGIAVNQKADSLWFIHAANYVPHSRTALIAKYVMNYSDGTTAEFPVRGGYEVEDWSGLRKAQNAVICWTGYNRMQKKLGLYMTRWDNPNPDKTIESIDIIGALDQAQLGIIGIAGGKKQN